jgi:hypothetical protein
MKQSMMIMMIGSVDMVPSGYLSAALAVSISGQKHRRAWFEPEKNQLVELAWIAQLGLLNECEPCASRASRLDDHRRHGRVQSLARCIC